MVVVAAQEAAWLPTSPPKLSATTGSSRSGSSRTLASTQAGQSSRRRFPARMPRAPVETSWDEVCTVVS